MEIAWLKAGQHPQFLATFQGHLITSESLHLRTSSVNYPEIWGSGRNEA